MAMPPAGANSFLGTRLDFLARTQNPDGGWGYFPGKQSWMEPTAWAAIALRGRPEADLAWAWMLGLQTADGSWRPGPNIRVSSWVTALSVTISHSRNEFGEPYKRGLHWLLETYDAESSLKVRALNAVGVDTGRNPDHKAWPWKPGNSAWIEPTAHALTALKLARKRLTLPEIGTRIAMGEAAILDQRCSDGGWNYGTNHSLGVALPSYPETTGLALLGLEDTRTDLSKPLEFAQRLLAERQGRVASAWLTIALRLHGKTVAESHYPELASNGDVLVTALEAMGVAGGAYQVLKTGDSQ